MSDAVLEMRDVSYRYEGGAEALHGVSLGIRRGERVAVVGENGAGKSTLLLLAAGLLLPSEGEIYVEGEPVTSSNLAFVRRRVGILFQNSDDQLFMPTVGEDVAFGPLNMHLGREEVERRVSESLRRVGALELHDRAPFQLSGGELKRAAMATVLAMQPEVMVLDEPTSSLDARGRREVVALLGTLPQTLLLVTHDMSLAERLCPRAIILHDGRVVADGLTTGLFADHECMRRYGLE